MPRTPSFFPSPIIVSFSNRIITVKGDKSIYYYFPGILRSSSSTATTTTAGQSHYFPSHGNIIWLPQTHTFPNEISLS